MTPITYVVPMNYTAGQLVKVAQTLRREPDATWRPDHEFARGQRRPASQWFHFFHEKLTEKINSHDPRFRLPTLRATRDWTVLSRLNRMTRQRNVIRPSDLNGLSAKYRRRLEGVISCDY